ncbi:MAG: SfiI family type II restriction endonuclease [Pseudomonadota bacterium]|nr:SfiI family type II restriction endonuclease [Pseudomonadota bacterium]
MPNGRLQDRYNPDHVETIWMAGRNAPSRGEDFRVRLSFSALGEKARWRVQTIEYDTNNKCILATSNG